MISYDTIGHCKFSCLFKLLGTQFNFVTVTSRYLRVNSNFVSSSRLKLNNGMKTFYWYLSRNIQDEKLF